VTRESWPLEIGAARGSCEAGPGRFNENRASRPTRRDADYDCAKVGEQVTEAADRDSSNTRMLWQ
jgi:hypothetical protein